MAKSNAERQAAYRKRHYRNNLDVDEGELRARLSAPGQVRRTDERFGQHVLDPISAGLDTKGRSLATRALHSPARGATLGSGRRAVKAHAAAARVFRPARALRR